MLKYFIGVALVLSALAVPVAARSETKAKMLLSAPGDIPGGSGVFYNEYFDTNGNFRNFSGMNFDLDVDYPMTGGLYFAAGSFRSGFDNGQSFFAGAGMETDLAPGISAGIETGALTRYSGFNEDKHISPAIIPYMQLGDDDGVHLNLLGMLPMGDTPGVIGFNLTVPLHGK